VSKIGSGRRDRRPQRPVADPLRFEADARAAERLAAGQPLLRLARADLPLDRQDLRPARERRVDPGFLGRGDGRRRFPGGQRPRRVAGRLADRAREREALEAQLLLRLRELDVERDPLRVERRDVVPRPLAEVEARLGDRAQALEQAAALLDPRDEGRESLDACVALLHVRDHVERGREGARRFRPEAMAGGLRAPRALQDGQDLGAQARFHLGASAVRGEPEHDGQDRVRQLRAWSASACATRTRARAACRSGLAAIARADRVRHGETRPDVHPHVDRRSLLAELDGLLDRQGALDRGLRFDVRTNDGASAPRCTRRERERNRIDMMLASNGRPDRSPPRLQPRSSRTARRPHLARRR
jgi:hypothetical protein